MRNVIILGSGRSGTSMLSGCLVGAGYYMGDRLVRANEANPKGFFEDLEVNRLNEEILAPLLPRRVPLLWRWLHPERLRRRQFWLAELPVGTPVTCPPHLVPRLSAFVRREPFCLKDPRFCLTLPAWREHLEDACFLVVFRNPLSTARSILKECGRASYLADLRMDQGRALRSWVGMYRHVLEVHRREGDWTFLHYEQILDGSGLDRVAEVTGAALDREFPEPGLRRSRVDRAPEGEAARVYRTLCRLAGVQHDLTGARP